MTRKVVILGATGSIGRQALDVARAHPDRFEVIGLVAGNDADALAELARAWPDAATGMGSDAAVDLAASSDADVVLNAIVGAVGLRASLAALEAGNMLALANKESLVAGGELCRAACARGGGLVLPVDSEHAALAQCLEGRDRSTVRRLVLTASGGPFRTRTDLSDVTVKEALAHPTWSMGPKITIDCATLMNKGLEVIEAHFLFGFDVDDIDVVVHPQSMVHALVELIDGSFVMQAAPTDMRIPIQAALTAPDRVPSPADRIDPREFGSLTFESLDEDRFPAVGLAYEALRAGGTAPATLNAANEVAVQAFLDERLAFDAITRVVHEVLDAHTPGDATTLEGVLDADAEARSDARSAIDRLASAVGSSS
jgi:1-deoxy-D-xylulose-5-phosphate reductoisomerase